MKDLFYGMLVFFFGMLIYILFTADRISVIDTVKYKEAVVIDIDDDFFVGNSITLLLPNGETDIFLSYDIIEYQYNVGDTIK